jgi:hypothetical protein
VNGAEDGSAGGFRHRDLDLHQTPSVHDDALELVTVHQNRDELTFVKGLHFAEPTPTRARAAGVDGLELAAIWLYRRFARAV